MDRLAGGWMDSGTDGLADGWAGGHTYRRTGRDRQRQAETGRDRQRQADTGRHRQTQADTGRDRQTVTHAPDVVPVSNITFCD
jgi:hypothetical protein